MFIVNLRPPTFPPLIQCNLWMTSPLPPKDNQNFWHVFMQIREHFLLPFDNCFQWSCMHFGTSGHRCNRSPFRRLTRKDVSGQGWLYRFWDGRGHVRQKQQELWRRSLSISGETRAVKSFNHLESYHELWRSLSISVATRVVKKFKHQATSNKSCEEV